MLLFGGGICGLGQGARGDLGRVQFCWVEGRAGGGVHGLGTFQKKTSGVLGTNDSRYLCGPGNKGLRGLGFRV